MAKIHLTGRINGDFIVIGEYAPLCDTNGKKKLRWLCECQTCHEKEVVLDESIRRNRHRFCSYCLATSSDNFSKLREDVAKMSKESEAAGYGPITVKQFINACKGVRGSLAQEDKETLPGILTKMITMV